MFEFGLGPESIGLLAEYNYHLYSAKNASFFVTSDNPVALYYPNYDKIRPYGVGLAMKGVEVTLPLSSDTLIRAGRELKPGASVASVEEVEEFNRRTIVMSERYVFASVVNTELRRKIGELKDVRAGFAFDNLFYGDGSVQRCEIHSCAMIANKPIRQRPGNQCSPARHPVALSITK